MLAIWAEQVFTIGVVGGSCLFDHGGCVLHKVGAEEGDKWRYKPWHCVVFPLTRARPGDPWYVRQWRYRGEAWMREPCRSCDERHQDHGGCRCQAYLLTGDPAAADPVCALSPDHHRIEAARAEAADDARTVAELTPRNVHESRVFCRG